MDYIDEVHLGVELLRYRLAEKNQVPFPLFLADRLANHGFAIGPQVDKSIVEVLPVMAMPCRSSLSQRDQWNF